MTQFRTLPVDGGDNRQVAEVVRGIMDGRTNNTGSVTLSAGSAITTSLNDPRIGQDSSIVFGPVTANAAAFMNSMYVSAKVRGVATITHPANSATDRTFKYIIVG